MTTIATSVPLFAAPRVVGLTEDNQGILQKLVTQWAAKQQRNLLRNAYADMRTKLKDLSVAIPPELVGRLAVVCGWPQKAVVEIANRIVLDGVQAGTPGDSDAFGVDELLRKNRFGIEFPQAVTSSVTHSVAFVSATPGDPSLGEPEILFQFHSALWTTALWNWRTRSLKAGLLINDVDDYGQPTRMTLMTPGEITVCVRGNGGWFVDQTWGTGLGWRIPLEALPFKPDLDRPFGRSRIDRATMSLTDRALRAAARLEVHSELFSAIKLILLGVDQEAFVGPGEKPAPLWSFYMGRLNLLSRDENGDVPKIEQIASQSPEPHIAVLRQLAQEFSSHTGVPLESMAVRGNPQSGDAKREARQDIVQTAESQHAVYQYALQHVLEAAVMLRDGLLEPPDELRNIVFRWRKPVTPTLAAQADAGAKQVAAVPGLSETEVGLELLGLSSDQIRRVQAERAAMRGKSLLDRALAAKPGRAAGLDEASAESADDNQG